MAAWQAATNAACNLNIDLALYDMILSIRLEMPQTFTLVKHLAGTLWSMTLDASLPLIDHAPDPVSHRLWREADVFFGGIVPGFTDAVVSHPGKTLENLGISTGIGMVATVATEVSSTAMPKLLKAVVGISALISYATDLAPSIDTTSEAFKRTWQSGSSVATDRAVIGGSIGKFLFDTTLSSVGGIGGAKFGRNKLFHEAMLTPVGKDIPIPAWAQIRRNESLSDSLGSGRGNLAEDLQTSSEPAGRISVYLDEARAAGANEAVAQKDELKVTSAFVSPHAGATAVAFRNGQIDLETLDMDPIKMWVSRRVDN